VAYGEVVFERDGKYRKMSNIRLQMSRFAAKKVPALSLVLVATVGMVAGVLAATMIVTQKPLTGEAGTYHSNTGTFTIVDNGLAVVANTVASNMTTSVTFGATGTNKALVNTQTAGNWMDYIDFTTSLADSSSHTVTITIRSNTGPLGSTILVNAQTATLVAPGASSAAKVTIYLDLGTQSITAPLTLYINVN
jgi:tetrahydromethanopterin S-methyltransferase subunit C